MSLSKWSLEKIQFLLSHIEDFVDQEIDENVRKEIQTFEPQTGLDRVDSLNADPADPSLAGRLLERLAPFYEAGVLLQRADEKWRLTDLFWRGKVFGLDSDDRIDASKLMREISPLQVERARAETVLHKLGLNFVRTPDSAECFLFKPTSQTAYLLISDLPELFATDHIAATQRFLNKSFIY